MSCWIGAVVKYEKGICTESSGATIRLGVTAVGCALDRIPRGCVGKRRNSGFRARLLVGDIYGGSRVLVDCYPGVAAPQGLSSKVGGKPAAPAGETCDCWDGKDSIRLISLQQWNIPARHKGAGLGLVISQAVVQAYRGLISDRN
jgi:hypothetical protein